LPSTSTNLYTVWCVYSQAFAGTVLTVTTHESMARLSIDLVAARVRTLWMFDKRYDTKRYPPADGHPSHY